MQHVSLPEGWWRHAAEQLSENPFLEDQTEGAQPHGSPQDAGLQKLGYYVAWASHTALLSVCKLETFIPDNNKQRCYLGCWLNLDAGFIWASWAKKKTSISFWMMRTLMTLCASAECESISQRGGQGRMKTPSSFQVIIMADSISGVPNFQDLMPDDLRGNWCKNNRNKVHNTCNALKTSPNHPPTLVHRKTVFQETVPDAKRVGDHCSHYFPLKYL